MSISIFSPALYFSKAIMNLVCGSGGVESSVSVAMYSSLSVTFVL